MELDFFSQVDAASELLDRHGRVTLRGLSRQLGADPALLDEIVGELLVRGAARRDGDVLVANRDSQPQGGDGAPDESRATEPAAVEDEALGFGVASTLDDSAEIRHLTVLFCDAVGSTELSDQIDVETWSDAMRGLLELSEAAVSEFGGWVSGFRGDGLMAVWGYPVALEDAAERAVRSGLAMLEAMRGYNAQLEPMLGRSISMRVGIHSGPCVVSTFGGSTQVMGLTANVGARIESVAPHNSVAISADTRRLVSGVFVLEDLGSHQLKGISDPMPVSRVVRVGGSAQRLDLAAHRRALVGRNTELAELRSRWKSVVGGEGRMVEVIGEAGIGKSRLVDAFRDSIADEPNSWLDAFCSPYAQAAPLMPIIDLLRRALRLDLGRPAAAQQAALAATLNSVGLDGERGSQLLADLLGKETSDPPNGAIGAIDAEAQRTELLDLVVDWVLALGKLQPIVLVMEDMHWADPTTIDLLSRLGARIANEPVLLIVLAREEGAPTWRRRSNLSSLTLDRLSRDQVVQIAAAAAGQPLADDVLAAIVERADGVPLFVEELAAAVGSGGELTAVPDTLQNLLMARLERLDGVRDVAQVASVVGRVFRVDDILLISELSAKEIVANIELGVEEELFFRRGTHRDADYFFKHALLRDAVYESLVSRSRRAYHGRYAAGLIRQRPDLAKDRPDLVAEHLTLADETAVASVWWERAAEEASLTSAVTETEALYRRAIATAGKDDTARQVRLRLALAGTINGGQGWASPAASVVWDEVNLLTRAADFEAERVLAESARATGRVVACDFAAARGELQAARESAVAIGAYDAVLGLLQSKLAMLNFEGYPEQVLEHFDDDGELGGELRSERGSDAFDRAMGTNNLAMSHAWRSYSLAMTGRFVSALAANDRAVELARGSRVSRPATLTNLLTLRSTIFLARDDLSEYLAACEKFLASARHYQLSYFETMGWATSETARVLVHPSKEAMNRLDARLGALAGTGKRLAAPIFAWSLAGAQLACDEPERASQAIAMAADAANSTGQHWYDPQILARRLHTQQQLGELPEGWHDEVVAMRAFAEERSLRVGALHLAMIEAELADTPAGRAAAADALRRAIAGIPEPDGARIVTTAQELLTSIG